MHTFDFVSIGAYTKDTIVTRSGTRQVDGGGYSYAAHAARLADLSVGAVTRLAPEDRRSTELLRKCGVEVMVYESPKSTLMRLEYPTANVDERILTVTDVADPFEPEHVANVQAQAVLVSASIRGEVSYAVVEALRSRGADGLARSAAACVNPAGVSLSSVPIRTRWSLSSGRLLQIRIFGFS